MSPSVLAIFCAAGASLPLSGFVAWKRFTGKHPEARELKHFGLATFLSGGLTLVGAWFALLLGVRAMRKDAALWRWLGTPLSIWTLIFAVNLIVDMFLPASVAHGWKHASNALNTGAFALLVIRGWKSPDELIRLCARKNVQLIILIIAGVVFYEYGDAAMHANQSMATQLSAAGMYLSLLVGVYVGVQESLAFLIPATRVMPERRGTFWAVSLLAGVGALALVALAPCVHHLIYA